MAVQLAKKGEKQTATIKTEDIMAKFPDSVFTKVAVTDPISFKITVVSVDGQAVTDDSGIVADPLTMAITQCTALPIAPAKLPPPALMELQTKAVTVLVEVTKDEKGTTISVSAISPKDIVLAWKASTLADNANLKFSLLDKSLSFDVPATVNKKDNSLKVDSDKFRENLPAIFKKGDSVPSTIPLSISVNSVDGKLFDAVFQPAFTAAVADTLNVTVFRCSPPSPPKK